MAQIQFPRAVSSAQTPELKFHAGRLLIDSCSEDIALQSLISGEQKGDSNFHSGNPTAQAGNFHSGDLGGISNLCISGNESNFHAGKVKSRARNFHAGDFADDDESNFHVGKTNFHAGSLHEENFHAGKYNFHAGDATTDSNFHAGNFHVGNVRDMLNFHAGNFHAGGSKNSDSNFHRGQNFHTGNYHAGANYHAGTNFHTGSPSEVDKNIYPTPLNKADSKSITATVSFYAATADGKPAYNYVEKPATSSTYSNVLTSSHQVPIEDIRGRHQDFNLDQNAVLALTGLREHGRDLFNSDEQVVQMFYPDVVETLLNQVPGAQHVVIFDHTIRRQNGDRGPVLRAHIDQTPASALARVRRHLSCPGAEQLLSGRVRLVNYWRPINGSVETYPLAFADSQTVRDEDLVSVEHRYPGWTGATFGVKYREDQKWFYWGGMGGDEGLLLQCFDSEHAARLAHSAVLDPDSVSDKVRESIEVRALIFG
ncbi:hypothetical protein BP5796_06527 [Coleophoma crateriformis]|uniref:Uncharacterized protein n=1 Tax=Coleophoma crateriformis TaxID=565419 RepID=A0A3D8RP28_9HELO|nr:hypothetical protein BP5796_06527 [Coleophoma crateriformis]